VTAAARRSDGEKARVLVVDDDPEIRDVLVMALEEEGYEVRAGHNGRAALEILERWRPRVILLDLMMPEMDGYELRAAQLSSRALADIPVIVLTAGQNIQGRVAALNATAILPKPFNLDLLLSMVESVVA
jgi:CheY-like chemotaxis protein